MFNSNEWNGIKRNFDKKKKQKIKFMSETNRKPIERTFPIKYIYIYKSR